MKKDLVFRAIAREIPVKKRVIKQVHYREIVLYITRIENRSCSLYSNRYIHIALIRVY
jgi:hypothetical protein